jgi:hypothetical protein
MSGIVPGVPHSVNAMEAAFEEIDGGWGNAFGDPFRVFRLSTTTPSTGILDDRPVIPSIYARIERMSARDVLEAEIFQLVAFDAKVDATDLVFGDVIQDCGTGTVYTYVQHRKTRKKIWMRTESLATITRPTPLGGQPGQQPASGARVSPYFGENHKSALPLVLSAGAYSFVSGGLPVIVPIGISDNVRASEGTTDQGAGALPTKLPITQFEIYVPDLNGMSLQLRDVLHVGADDYKVLKVLNTGSAGLEGNVCICSRVPLGG